MLLYSLLLINFAFNIFLFWQLFKLKKQWKKFLDLLTQTSINETEKDYFEKVEIIPLELFTD